MRGIWDFLRRGALIGALACGGLATPADAQEEGSEKVGDWSVVHHKMGNGAEYCGVIRGYTPKVVIYLDRLSTERETIITVYSEGAPRIRSGAAARVAVEFVVGEAVQRFQLVGYGANTRDRRGISVPVYEEVADLFEEASAMRVVYSNYTSPPLPLFGSSKALEAFRACIAEHF